MYEASKLVREDKSVFDEYKRILISEEYKLVYEENIILTRHENVFTVPYEEN